MKLDTIDKGMVGTVPVKKIYLGSQMIWEQAPGGPVLLCPYVMDSQATIGFSAFDSWSFVSGVGTGVTPLTATLCGAAPIGDLDRLNSPSPGESHTQTLVPGSGKIAIEGEVTQLSDGDHEGAVTVSVFTGNLQDNNYAQLDSIQGSSSVEIRVSGAGARLLAPTATRILPGSIEVGDRVGIVIDTDSGVGHFLSKSGHENFNGIPLIDMSDGGGFIFTMELVTDAISSPVSGKVYTKAADMQLPYPAGTTDTCLTGGLRELVAYPLDASEAELQGAGLTGKLDTPTLAQQRGEHTVSAVAPGATQQFSMAKSPSDPNFSVDMSAGAVALEFEMLVPTFSPMAGGTGGILANARGEIVSAINFQPSVLMSVFLNDDGTRAFQGSGPNGQTGTVSISQSLNRVGLLIDNNTNTLRMWLNGVEEALTNGAYPAGTFASVTPIVNVLRNTLSDNGGGGSVLTNRLITEPYFFTTPFPAGSRDINGNVFN